MTARHMVLEPVEGLVLLGQKAALGKAGKATRHSHSMRLITPSSIAQPHKTGKEKIFAEAPVTQGTATFPLISHQS